MSRYLCGLFKKRMPDESDSDSDDPRGGDRRSPRPGTSRSSLSANAFKQRTPDIESASEITRRQGEILKDFLKRKKAALKNVATPLEISGDTLVQDPYEKADKSIHMVRCPTGLITDPQMMLHKCEWDYNYPEAPARLEMVSGRIVIAGLFERCVRVTVIDHSELFKDVAKVHDLDLFYDLHHICQKPVRDMETMAAKFESVCFNGDTHAAAKKALDCSITLAAKVAKGELQNGLVLVRPPGHLSTYADYRKYCYFNTVAVTAHHLLTQKYVRKILIIDFGVHHSQSTQQTFYKSDQVLCFSIHRYQNGTFWPQEFEANFNFIGVGDGQGYNINVPLNDVGMGDSEYIAIFTHILLPIAYEFQPDIVLISAGYGASIGCPEGRMEVTPGCYHHIIQLLAGVAQGKTVVCLEGGYFLPSLSEGVTCTLKGLLGDPCPVLDNLTSVNLKLIETMNNLRRLLLPFWTCMKVNEVFDVNEVSIDNPGRTLEIRYFGEPSSPPFLTRDCHDTNTEEEASYYEARIRALRDFKYDTIPSGLPVAYCVHDAMSLHDADPKTFKKFDHRPEKPERLSKILEKMDEMGMAARLMKVRIKLRDDLESYSPHMEGWISSINNREDTPDVYRNNHTVAAVQYAISGLFSLIDEIMQDNVISGIGLVRPPGHHAEHQSSSGFCHANNIAFAANYLTSKYSLRRVLIVDFDIHHGNGTQQMFYTSENVLYLSIHRFDDGKYFPHGSHGNYTYDGYGSGKGYNVNIPFNKKKMGNTEYMSAFFHLVLPIAYDYQPEFVLISAGFDAGVHDPLGGYLVTPEMFGHMVSLLRVLARGKLLLALEGGYNLTTTSLGMILCMKALLGDPLPMADDVYKSFEPEGIETIRKVSCHFKQYYPCLQVMRPLPCVPVLLKKIDVFQSNNYHDCNSYKILDMKVALDSHKVINELEKLKKNERH